MARHAAFIFATLALVSAISTPRTSANQSNTVAPTDAPVKAAAETLNVSVDTVFVAKLVTNLDPRQSKAGDAVEAEAKQDIKQGNQVLLKKGSSLLGHVKAVQLPTAEKPLAMELVFDGVKMPKTGQQYALHLIIKALAPEANITNNDTLFDGRGMDSSTSPATVSGHTTTMKGTVNQITSTSVGVYDLSGITLGDQTTQGGGHMTVVASSSGGLHLVKGMQLVMKVVSQ